MVWFFADDTDSDNLTLSVTTSTLMTTPTNRILRHDVYVDDAGNINVPPCSRPGQAGAASEAERLRAEARAGVCILGTVTNFTTRRFATFEHWSAMPSTATSCHTHCH